MLWNIMIVIVCLHFNMVFVVVVVSVKHFKILFMCPLTKAITTRSNGDYLNFKLEKKKLFSKAKATNQVFQTESDMQAIIRNVQ